MVELAYRAIGQRVPMLEGPTKVSGEIRYTTDVKLPGLLHGRILRSPHPHARIKRIDVSRAAALPGVHAVVTAADTPLVKYFHLGGPLQDRYPLAVDKVRFVGEEVAGVAAETPELAARALELIRVDYEPLPAAFDPAAARRPDAPIIHAPPQPGGEPNVVVHARREFGDVEAAFRAADEIFEDSYYFPPETHCCLEPNGTVASWDRTEQKLTVWTSTQAPYFIHKELSAVLGLPPDKVRVMEVAVGGGFGAKSKITEHEAICALLTMKAGRPVRLILSREEEFTTTKTRHAMEITLRTGVRRDGTLLVRDARVVCENGAYNAVGPAVMGFGGAILAAMYRLQAVRYEGRLVYTNKQPGGQFRGYGNPQVTFAIESQMDVIAERLGLDPLELRLQNANRAGETTLNGWKITSCGFDECLRQAAERIGWAEQRRNPRPGRGLGIAGLIHVSGAHVYPDGDYSVASVALDGDGTVTVRIGAADPGTWQNTVLGQIAAEELGVPMEQVRVQTMDTDQTPHDLGTWGSRVIFVGGNAVRKAAVEVREKVLAAAAERLEVAPADLDWLGDGVAVRGAPERVLALAEAIGAVAEQGDGAVLVETRYDAPSELINRETGIANISGAYTFAAQAAEVAVDLETGLVRVERLVAAHDVGRALNPTAVEGQIEGGVAMGLGAALSEELVYQDGRLVNPSLLYYEVPKAADLPRIESIVVETDDPAGPFGAKGVGEPGLVPTPAAVANAVAQAAGVRITRLPITPEKVLEALLARRGDRLRPRPLLVRPDRWEVALLRRLYPKLVLPLLDRWGTRLARRRPRREHFELLRPKSVAEALRQLGGRDRHLLGGGTDLLVRRGQGLVAPSALIDVREIAGLGGIGPGPGGLEIGAAVALADLAADPVAAERYPLLRAAIEQIAGAQVREMATVGGNLCQDKRCWFYRNGFTCYKRGGPTCPCYAVTGDHRYHAILEAGRCQAVAPSDLATVAAAYGGFLRISGPRGERQVAVDRFYRGPGEPDLRPDELVTHLVLPEPGAGVGGGYEKLVLREGDFPIATAAAVLRAERGRVAEVRLVLGAVAPKPYRAGRAERYLRGRALGPDELRRAAELALADAHPLSGNGYKVEVSAALARRALRAAWDRARNGSA